MNWVGVALGLVLLTGCGKKPKDIEIKSNPHPKVGYKVIVDFSQVPDLPTRIAGHVSYAVKSPDDACQKFWMRDFEKSMPWGYHSLELEEVDLGVYESVFYLDKLLDERYFNRGVCAWKLSTLTISSYGRKGNGFGLLLNESQIKPGYEEKVYFNREVWEQSNQAYFHSSMSIPFNQVHPVDESSGLYFFIKISVEPIPGNPGLTVSEEFKNRQGQELTD